MIVVKASIIKSLNERQDKKQLEYFKKELTKVLEQAEKRENNAISKAIEDYDNSMAKTFLNEYGIEKARGYGIGTVREWKGEKFRKIAPGKWRKIYESNTRGAKQSIGIIKKKIMNAKTTDELLQIVMENTNRFMDANGKLLPIVEELKKAVNESKGKLNEGKPSTQEQIDKFKKENGKSEEEQYNDEISVIDAAYNKLVHVDINKNDYENMKTVYDEANELYKEITKNMREADDNGDRSKVWMYERLKDRLHSVLSRVQWRYNEVEQNHTKAKFFEGIENEKDFKRTDIPESEDEAIAKFEKKINDFVNEHKKNVWSINTDLINLIKNETNKKAAQRWCILSNVSNYDELLKEVEHKINVAIGREKEEKAQAAKKARNEKIKKINQQNEQKTYTDEEINKALEGINSLIAERDRLKEQLKEAIDKENDARKRYDIGIRNRDENRHAIWDEVLDYRKQVNKLAEERDSFEKKLDNFMDPIAYYYLNNYKYHKDESINECKTVAEVENLIKSKDWYSGDGMSRLSLDKMSISAAKEVFKCMERIFAIFPEQKGSNVSLKMNYANSNTWACASKQNGITFNSKYYSNYDELRADYDKTEGNFHPMGTSAEDIVFHEYFHVMTAGNGFSLAKRIKQNVTKRLKMRGSKGGPKQDDIIKYGVSEYATKNADEFGAECFCQALGAENPTAFAIEVFKETLKYKKYMRGMV